jgi:radical SAM superfamily enzyme YgiQ (UPF0313 family)
MLSISKPKSSDFFVLLVSCYELGHQPAGIVSPAGFLAKAGLTVEGMDVSVEGFDAEKAARAAFVGISVPMHTALRLGVKVGEAIRKLNPACHVCFFGLYASLNADYLLSTVADSVIGGEFESALAELATQVSRGLPIDAPGVATKQRNATPIIARVERAAPDRRVVAPLDRYARLDYQNELRLTGYVEATRGCLHRCTHCPIPPVYDGRFFAAPIPSVVDDIRGLAAAGARHITFGDPDFLNGPTHSIRIARTMHEELPDLTFDFTAKVEHLIKHAELMPEFARLGCIFVVSAVESLSDTVLSHLDKGHTREDITRALEILRAAGIAMRPSFVAFTPWTTIDDYVDVLDWVEEQGMIDSVDPVQFGIRLLVPPGSLLLKNPVTAAAFGRLNQDLFSYEWVHPDPGMDRLHADVTRTVEEAAQTAEDAVDTFYKIRELAYADLDRFRVARWVNRPEPYRLKPPRLTEAWFC